MDAIEKAELLLLQHQTNQTARRFMSEAEIILFKLLHDESLTHREYQIAAGIIACQFGNWLIEDSENEIK